MRECEQGIVARDRIHHSCCDEIRALELQGIQRVHELDNTAARWQAMYESSLVQLDTLKLQISEINKILLGAISDTAKVIRIEGVLAKTEKRDGL